MAERAKLDTTVRKTLWQDLELRDQHPPLDRKWSAEDEEAAKSWRDWLEQDGLPLAKFRPL